MDTIQTDRLRLRAMTGDDLEDLLGIFRDPKVMASFGGSLFSRRQMQGWIERNLAHQQKYGYGLFSVIHESDGNLIGNCGLEHTEVCGEPVVELGYDFLSSYWGRGLATEAASAVRDYAFDVLGLKRMVSLIRIHNVASQRVSEKLGMRSERELTENGIEYALYSVCKRGQQHGAGDTGQCRCS